MRIAVFWVVAPYCLVEVFATDNGVARTSKTSVNIYWSTRRINPQENQTEDIFLERKIMKNKDGR